MQRHGVEMSTDLQKKFRDCIIESQDFVRKQLQDSAFVSLRDVARCLKVEILIFFFF